MRYRRRITDDPNGLPCRPYAVCEYPHIAIGALLFRFLALPRQIRTEQSHLTVDGALLGRSTDA